MVLAGCRISRNAMNVAYRSLVPETFQVPNYELPKLFFLQVDFMAHGNLAGWGCGIKSKYLG